MRFGDRGPGQDDGRRHDLAYRLLASAVRAMRPGRRVWGQAMLAELEHVRSPGERARFALGATLVALFPPRDATVYGELLRGLVVRAAVAGAAIYALAPAAGPAAAALAALPAAGAWGMLTMPVLTSRSGGAVLAAQVAVVAGVMGCVGLVLATVQRYPQVMSMGSRPGWAMGVVLDVVATGYLAAAWLLARRFPATQRNTLPALAAGLVTAAAAAYYVAHPSLADLWSGPLPGAAAYLVTGIALLAAGVLAGSRRGRIQDGLETAVPATLLAALTTSIMIMAATWRVAPAAGGSAPIAAQARDHGVASAAAWLTDDNVGGAIVSLIWTPALFLTIAVAGAVIGCALRTAITRRSRVRRA